MEFTREIIVFDAPDLPTVSAFWAGLLGGRVEAEDDWHTVYVDDRPHLGFQLAPDHRAPDWPANDTPQQLHLDYYLPNKEALPAAHDEVLALGGRMVQAAHEDEPDSGFQVYADPAGHPFCLCWG